MLSIEIDLSLRAKASPLDSKFLNTSCFLGPLLYGPSLVGMACVAGAGPLAVSGKFIP